MGVAYSLDTLPMRREIRDVASKRTCREAGPLLELPYSGLLDRDTGVVPVIPVRGCGEWCEREAIAPRARP